MISDEAAIKEMIESGTLTGYATVGMEGGKAALDGGRAALDGGRAALDGAAKGAGKVGAKALASVQDLGGVFRFGRGGAGGKTRDKSKSFRA